MLLSDSHLYNFSRLLWRFSTHSSEEISLKILVSSAKREILAEISLSISFMRIRNKRGPSTLPCGTPLVTLDEDDLVLLTMTCWVLWDRKDWIHLPSFPVTPAAFSFLRSIPLSTLSNAFLKSKYSFANLAGQKLGGGCCQTYQS